MGGEGGQGQGQRQGQQAGVVPEMWGEEWEQQQGVKEGEAGLERPEDSHWLKFWTREGSVGTNPTLTSLGNYALCADPHPHCPAPPHKHHV